MKKTSFLYPSIALLALLLPPCLPAQSSRMDAPAANCFFNNYPPIYYPASSHWISAISAMGDSLEIEDGSTWELDPWDGTKALYWKAKTPLTITQNTSWFSRYNFRIVNQDTGDSIAANLTEGPFEDSQYTNFISIIDRRQGALALTNQMNLVVCPSDESIFAAWHEGNAIIVGMNAGWHNGTYDLILINVNKDNFVRARQL